MAGKKVWVCGHRGMVGSAIVRRLATEDCAVLTAGSDVLDLRDGAAVQTWMRANRPDFVFMAAAKVGGILANRDFPADFLYDNLMIEANVIKGAADVGVEKLLLLGSSCIYPKHATQPMPESALLTGPLEPTNEWYAIAKIAGVKLCQAFRAQHGCDFISAMPTNLYGEGDNFDLTSSHVLPALMRKVHEAKVNGQPTVEIWGTGAPLREFLHVDDLADACVHLAKVYSDPVAINVGSGQEVSIRALAELIADVVGYKGTFTFDASKPDGTPRKLLDTTLLASTGWTPAVTLRSGIAATYRWYLDNLAAKAVRQ
ncbi:MAG: GDP-L-fucose synthase [Hyphomonadaceae bacterium]|nr:GDP-L-fucose synthase [Hyphomonadaceae bacterium]